MRLKQVSVVNFKSYKGRTTVKLEDGRTLLVGRNGSGKSNFFQAVNFVLGTRSAILGQLARMRFFNNGRDDLKLTVNIVLEDEQEIIPGDIKITRTMGVRSDCFFLNGCRITRKELGFLLEVCGFSLSTPYYILNHSLMKVLVLSNPKQRLRSFIECIGLCISRTASFLDDRYASMAEMQLLIQETKAILDRFNVEEVDAAAAQLREYKTLIKQRAVLKIKLYSLLLAKYENLGKDEYEAISLKKEHAHIYASELHELKCQITVAEESSEKCKSDLATSQLMLSDLEAERETLLRNETRLSLRIGDLEKQLSVEESNISREESGSSKSDSTSERPRGELEKQFEDASGKFAREKSNVEALERLLNEKKQAHHHLLLKRGYRDKFSTVKEMKQWINNELLKLRKMYNDSLADIKNCVLKLEEYKKAIDTCDNEIKTLDQQSMKLHAALRDECVMKRKVSELLNELNELHRQENSAVNHLDTLMKCLKSRKTDLVLKVGSSVFDGFDSVRKVIAILDHSASDAISIPDSCFGAVLQNLSFDPSLNLAIDAAAGSRLLAQIVSTDTVGTVIMKKINSLELPGSVCFLPLNRIIPPQRPYSSRDDAVPLIDRLQFPQSVENVMVYLFGRVMLCRDLKVAAQVARESGCSCVTMDGDRVTRTGSLSGGFMDPMKSTSALLADFESVESSHRNQIVSLDKIRLAIDEKKSTINAAMSQIQQLQRDIRTWANGSAREILTKRVESLKAEEKNCAEQLNQLHCDNKVLLRTRQALLNSAQEAGEEEPLSTGEVRAIEELNKQIFEMTKAVNKKRASLAALESKLSSTALELARSKEAVALKATDVQKFKILRQKLADLNTRYHVIITRLMAVEEKISVASASVNTAKLNMAKLDSELGELKKKLQLADEQNEVLNLSVAQEKITSLEQKMEEIKLSRELEMNCHRIKNIEEPIQLTVGEIREQLKQMNEAINGLESAPVMSEEVIKRHRKFLLIKEKTEVGEEEYAAFYVLLWDVLSWVQQHIQCCLENVAELYSHYFSMMVEGGCGSIVFESSEDEEEKAVKFSGIFLSNQFSGGLSLSQMKLLSQGQRVVVLLSIVFAFMKRQRTGFCIMDEIDQSLSASHIRGMLQAMTEFKPHQFLISSHNKTMISIGDHFYVLRFKKSSSIKPASRSEVMQFMKEFLDQSSKPSTSLFTTSSQQSDSSELTVSSVLTNN